MRGRACFALIAAVALLATASRSARADAVDSLDAQAPPSSLRSGGPAHEPTPRERGRHELMTAAGVMGVGCYSIIIAGRMESSDPFDRYLLGMAVAGGSIGTAWLVDRAWPATPAAADLAGYGATRGMLHGWLLREASGANARDPDRERLDYGVAVSVGEAALGYAIAKRLRMDEDAAAAAMLFGDLGMCTGDAIAQLQGPPGDVYGSLYYDDRGWWYPRISRSDRRRVDRDALIGGLVGPIAGTWLQGRRHWSQGDASTMEAAALLGVTSGVLAVGGETRGPGGRRLRAQGGMLGGAVALAVADRLVAGGHVSTQRGRAIESATFGGSLVGLGLGALTVLETGRDFDHAYLWWAWSGGATGFIVAFAAGRGSGGGSPASEPVARRWNLSLQPAAFLALAEPPARGAVPPPLVTLSVRLP